MPSSPAALFAALGDETRLRLILELSESGPTSISRLSDGFNVTRQAITKHLRVMEDAGLASSSRAGRESVWALEEERLEEARFYLTQIISKQWDDAIDRLRAFVEDV